MLTTRFKIITGFESSEVETKANSFFERLPGVEVVKVQLMAKAQGYALLVVYQIFQPILPTDRESRHGKKESCKPTAGAGSR
jgi:hypothetical protein